MVRELLLSEMALKGVVGLVLLAFPRSFTRVVGLAVPAETIWPRLLGMTLIGLAIATAVELETAARHGLGLGGHIALNLTGALCLVALIILGRAAPSRRGRIMTGLMALLLAGLAMIELAWA